METSAAVCSCVRPLVVLGDCMDVIEIPSQLVQKKTRSNYAVGVINNGHIPGYLSGSNLKGNAKHWGSTYHHYRRTAYTIVHELTGCVIPLSYAKQHNAILWGHQDTNAPVKVVCRPFTADELVAFKAKQLLLGRE